MRCYQSLFSSLLVFPSLFVAFCNKNSKRHSFLLMCNSDAQKDVNTQQKIPDNLLVSAFRKILEKNGKSCSNLRLVHVKPSIVLWILIHIALCSRACCILFQHHCMRSVMACFHRFPLHYKTFLFQTLLSILLFQIFLERPSQSYASPIHSIRHPSAEYGLVQQSNLGHWSPRQSVFQPLARPPIAFKIASPFAFKTSPSQRSKFKFGTVRVDSVQLQ